MEYLWIPFIGLVACVISLVGFFVYMGYECSSVSRRRRRHRR